MDGGIVGRAEGSYKETISNCINFGEVCDGGYVSNSNDYSYGETGGICGNACELKTVEGCINNSSIINSEFFAGGILGGNWGTAMDGCINKGKIVGRCSTGGICGYVGLIDTSLQPVIENCINENEVKTSGQNSPNMRYPIEGGTTYTDPGADALAGGITGEGSRFIYRNCSNSGSVDSAGFSGGIFGACVSAGETGGCLTTVESCSNYGAITGGGTTGGMAGLGERCYFKNNKNYQIVTSRKGNAGGIAGGVTSGTLVDNINFGSIVGVGCVGGICGYLGRATQTPSSYRGCTNSGSVSSSSSDIGDLFGLIGK